MDGQLPQTPAPKSRGIPLWTALVALLLLVIAAGAILAGILYYFRSDKLKLERENQALRVKQEETKLAEQKAGEEARLTWARNRQEEGLNLARSATNALQGLTAAADAVRTAAATLKTSEDGRRVALHPGLVRLARQLYEINLPVLPPAADIDSRLEGVRRIELQLDKAAGTTFVPGPELTGELQQAAAWAGDQARKTDEIRTLLRTLTEESKVKVTTATLTAASPTLEAAIQRLTEAELATQQQAAAVQTEEARKTATETVGTAEAIGILEEAQRKFDRRLAEEQAKNAALERELALQKAEQVKADAENKVATETVRDEARRLELLKKAQDPAIQATLKPLTAPGYWQIDKMSLELKPHSLTKLQTRGSLEATPRGATELARILTDKDDKVRPRLKMYPNQFLRHPEQLEQVTEIQRLLNELGPVLVELKMLEP